MQVYKEGILGSTWTQGRGLPPLPADHARFRLDLLPFERRQITHNGVEFKCNLYTGPELAEFISDGDPTSGLKPKKEKFLFRYDPNDLGVIYFMNPKTGQYVAIPVKDQELNGVSIPADKEYRRAKNQVAELEEERAKVRGLQAENREIVANATEATKQARKRSAIRSAKRTIAQKRAKEVRSLVPAPAAHPEPAPTAQKVIPLRLKTQELVAPLIEDMEW